MFPAEDVAIWQSFDSEQSRHVEHLNAMVHAVRDDVGDAAAVGSSGWTGSTH